MTTLTPEPSGRAWYLLQTKARQEARAQEHLERQGYHCFAPEIKVERLRRGRRQLLCEALFPGYLFIHLDRLADNWRPVRSTRGVSRFVSFNDQPLPVADAIIGQLQQRLAEAAEPTALRAGDRVRISQGAFAELDAVFERYDGTERVVILLELLNRTQRLTMPLGHICQT